MGSSSVEPVRSALDFQYSHDVFQKVQNYSVHNDATLILDLLNQILKNDKISTEGPPPLASLYHSCIHCDW